MASLEKDVMDLGFELYTPAQFKESVLEAISIYRNAIKKVKEQDNKNWDLAIQPLELAAEKLDRIWNLLEHVNAVCNTPEIRETYENLLQVATNFHSEVLQDEELYKIYTDVSAQETNLTIAQKTILEHAIRDFKLSGVNLEPSKRQKLKELHDDVSQLQSKFANNVLDATDDWDYHVTTDQKFILDGIPERVLASAKARAEKQNKEGWVFGLDSATCMDILTNAANRPLREEFYLAYNTRASDQGAANVKFDNTKVIDDILKARQAIAELTGFNNYAEYSIEPKMAKNTTEVNEFLEKIVSKVKPVAKVETEELKEFARKTGFAEELEAWDISYYAELMRKEKYQVNEEELRQYFPLPKVMQGMFQLVEKLYNLQIVEVQDFVSWHESVRLFKVIDSNKVLRGHFYIDLFSRPGKRSGAWMAECITRMRFGANLLQTSVAFLNCNFPPPHGDEPALLSHYEVETLFHEFGHTLHHVLTLVDYYSASGMNGVEWDAVELPSQLMENWTWEWDVIQTITEDKKTGKAMPKELFDKVLASKNFHAGLFLSRQLMFSLFDFRLHEHRKDDINKTANEVLNDVRDSLATFKTPSTNRFENSFQHIFAGGYAAGYYSYMWANVLACDAYQKLTTNELIDSRVGREFLTNVLEKGGSEPAMDLFVSFLGRKPSIDALLKNYNLL